MTLSVTAGSLATSAFVNSLAPQGVVKPTDESVTSSTTLQSDNDLYAPLNAGSFAFLLMVAYEGGTQGSSDLKIGFSVPASTTSFRASPTYSDTSGTAHVGNSLTSSSTIAAGTSGAGNLHTLSITGAVVLTTGGQNLTVQWAQNTSSSTSTIVHSGSSLILWQLS